jgi:hypothetical protein
MYYVCAGSNGGEEDVGPDDDDDDDDDAFVPKWGGSSNASDTVAPLVSWGNQRKFMDDSDDDDGDDNDGDGKESQGEEFYFNKPNSAHSQVNKLPNNEPTTKATKEDRGKLVDAHDAEVPTLKLGTGNNSKTYNIHDDDDDMEEEEEEDLSDQEDYDAFDDVTQVVPILNTGTVSKLNSSNPTDSSLPSSSMSLLSNVAASTPRLDSGRDNNTVSTFNAGGGGGGGGGGGDNKRSSQVMGASYFASLLTPRLSTTELTKRLRSTKRDMRALVDKRASAIAMRSNGEGADLSILTLESQHKKVSLPSSSTCFFSSFFPLFPFASCEFCMRNV